MPRFDPLAPRQRGEGARRAGEVTQVVIFQSQISFSGPRYNPTWQKPAECGSPF